MEVFLGSGTPDKFKIRPRSRTRQKAAPGIPPGYPRYTIFRCTPDSSNASISWMGRMKWEARERERGGGEEGVYGRIKNVTRRSHVPRIHDSYLFIYPV